MKTPSRLRAFAGNPSVLRHPLSAIGRTAAFTLVELLVVITIIAILAGLVLAAMGGVQKRGARDKAQSEIQALSAAIEEYFIDQRAFPRTNTGFLYAELTSDTAAGVVPQNTTKVYFEPHAAMVRTDGIFKTFIDPWDAAYQYTTNSSGYFEILSTAGSTNTNQWIRN
jgi:type II secretion system protein G